MKALTLLLLINLNPSNARKPSINLANLPSILKNENNLALKRHGNVKENSKNPFLRNRDQSSALVKIDLCGGACEDSNPVLFLKITLSSTVETAALVCLIVGSTKLSSILDFIPSIGGLSLLQWITLVVVIFFPSIIGSLIDGGLSAASKQILMPQMNPGDPNWYSNLKKPSWNPPGWLFPIMWLIVSKPTQLVAVSKIVKAANIPEKSLPLSFLVIYCSQLALGDAWNKVFFGLQCTGRGAAVISLFYGVLLATAYLFGTVDESAGNFMLPTCAWVTVAAALNWNIYLNN